MIGQVVQLMDYRRISPLLLFVALVLFGLRTAAAPMSWDGAKQGQFIVALAQDQQGQVWVGTEDQGAWRYNPANVEQPWTQFTTKDGLGDDNAYAIAVDKLGRVWVGHLNHGVSVFNGHQWANYSVLNGPLGERVFAIATCPTDGDVWIATNGGLARYSLQQDTWSYFTRTDGLVSDQMQALAFDRRGNLYAGTQCDGLAMAKAADGYKSWQTSPGPTHPTLRPYGKGLPSALINAVLVAQDDTIYVATDAGLARSRDDGATWQYGRGKDWDDKVKGRYGGPPNGWSAAEWKTDPNTQLAEDYCTCLAEDAAGMLWVGHQQQGFDTFKAQAQQNVPWSDMASGLSSDYVKAILSWRGQLLIGSYGNGLKSFSNNVGGSQRAQPLPPMQRAALPTSVKPPSLTQLNTMLKLIGQVAPAQNAERPLVVALDDDWHTQGEWLGRYGRYWACLAAMLAPHDYVWGAGPESVKYYLRIGSNHDPGDTIRYWIHWLFTTNPRTLEMPASYFDGRLIRKLAAPEANRRESEVDDHGETYPLTKDGPHLYATLQVPTGLFILSLYDFNKDGHLDRNRWRDYSLSLRPHPVGWPLQVIQGFAQEPELARGRIHDFWGGVYKKFLVRGPQTLTIEVNRNYSHNTILAAAMLDLVDEQPPPYFGSTESWQGVLRQRNATQRTLATEWLLSAPQSATAHAHRFRPGTTAAEAADRLWDEMEHMRFYNPVWWAMNRRQFYRALLLWYRQGGPSAAGALSPTQARLRARLGTCYYQMDFFNQWEECQQAVGLMPARQIEKSLRWDERIPLDSGQGYQVVTAYLAGLKQAAQSHQQAANLLPQAPKP